MLRIAVVALSALLLGCPVAGAFLSGMSSGLQQGTSTREVASARKTCWSDFGCGVGERCVKAPYRSQGYCAQEVNEYGTPTYAPPSTDSVMPGAEGQCYFDTDCPVGFHCAKEPGALSGACLKRF